MNVWNEFFHMIQLVSKMESRFFTPQIVYVKAEQNET